MRSPFTHLIIAAAVCAAALVMYGVWYAAVAGKSAAVASLQSQIDAKTLAMSRLAATRAALSEITSDEAEVQSHFVPEAAVVGFIDDLESRGTALGATVNVLSVSTGGTPAQPTLAFALSAKGTFDAVIRTVGMIEYLPYASSISALSVGWDAKNSWHADASLLVGSITASTATSTP